MVRKTRKDLIMGCHKPEFPITDVKVRLVEEGNNRLLAWASCIVSGAIRLDNIAIRRGLDGHLFLTYPNKVTTTGKKHSYFNPISTSAAQAIEDAVLTRLAKLAQLPGDPVTKEARKP
jgi:DNA-binding cell septation regulator SpoVG